MTAVDTEALLGKRGTVASLQAEAFSVFFFFLLANNLLTLFSIC